MAHDNYASIPSPGPLDLEDEVTFRREVNRLSARHRTSWTAVDLMATEFPPVRFAVPGLVPEGLMILGGKPKLGKSWLVLGWACAVAAGGKALSTRDVDQGEVLYLALEDSPRRLRQRLEMVLGPSQTPNMQIETAWMPLGDGGIDDLDRWLNEHPDARLVVIDTAQRIQKPGSGRDRYGDDYEAWGNLQSLAISHGVAMVAVHHLRKDDDPADWIDAITGSTGITGAVDTIAALFRERGAMDATLRITGRDLADEPELALSFQPDRGLWKEMGPAQQYRQSMERAAVLEAVRLLGGTAQVRDVAQSLEKSVAATSKLMVALADDSLLYPVKRGVYSLQKPVERGETVDTGTQLSTESTISTGLGEEDA